MNTLIVEREHSVKVIMIILNGKFLERDIKE